MGEDLQIIDDSELHRNFCAYGANAKEWTRKCALLLPAIHRQKIWEKKGFGSVFEYAAKLAGMSRSAVEEALWVVGRVEDKPDLLRVIEEKGVSAVRPVVSVATVATAAFWAEKAKEMSVRALQAYVHEAKRGNNLEMFSGGDLPDVRQNQPETMEITMQVPWKTGEALLKLKGGEAWGDLMGDLLEMREEELAETVPEEKVTDSRHIPAEMVKFVMRRSRGVCEFGMCKRKYEILHHTQRFVLEQVHDPDRIVALCKPHERVVHMGLVKDERVLPREWQVVMHADTSDERYEVDQVVQKYRRPK